jgi:hypothetical protein
MGESCEKVAARGIALESLSDSWYCGLRKGGERIQGAAAILESLKLAGIPALFPFVADASWPRSHEEEWKCLHVGLAAWEEDNDDNGGQPIHDCIFRAKAVSDMSQVGGSSIPGEVLHVQLRLNPRMIARRLVPLQPASVMAMTHADRTTSRCVEWRAVAFKKTRTRRRRKDEAGFRLLDNRDDSIASQPPGFQRWPLRAQQLRSLRWMQQCEVESTPFELILSQLHLDPGAVVSENADVGAVPDSLFWLDQDVKPKSASCKPAGNVGATDHLFGWRYELRCRECHTIRGGILGDAVGYGKTATMIGLIDSRHDGAHPSIPESREPYFFRSAATLILVPSNLLDQWVSEFNKFLDCHLGSARAAGLDRRLRIVPVRTATQLKALSVGQICEEADVVICSYRLLFSPVYRRRLLELAGNFMELSKSDSALMRAAADVGGLRRNTRRFCENPREVGWKHRIEAHGSSVDTTDDFVEQPARLRFPVLEQFWWRRIVFDEFHELEAMGNTAQFESLKNLCGHYRWGLTGTPPTRDLAQISVLARLFQIENLLHCQEASDASMVQRQPSKNSLGDADEIACTNAQGFLDHFARQNTGKEVLPVQLCEHIVEVRQSPEERAIYLQALHDCRESITGAEAPTPQDEPCKMDASSSERLLKLCSHFSYGVGAAASTNADSECSRILTKKEQHITRAGAAVKALAKKLELLWRLLPDAHAGGRAAEPDGQAEADANISDRESLLQCLQKQYATDISVPLAPGDADKVIEESAKPSTSCVTAASPTDPPSPAEQHVPTAVAAFDIALAALRESRRQSFSELRQKPEVAGDGGRLQPLENALRLAQANGGALACDVAEQAREDGKKRFLDAVKAYDAADRSHRFF